MVNFFTVDVEEWYHVNYDGVSVDSHTGSTTNLPRLVDRLLEILAAGHAKSTFFILQMIAERYPQVVRAIAGAGHEVASHGCAHESVYRMTPHEFRADVVRSCDTLSSLTGQRVLGFRAPSFSVTEEILPWYYDSLGEAGLEYSSSVYCGRTFLYGIPTFPYRIHRPSGRSWSTRIVEFPVTRLRAGAKTLGLYVRLFPDWFLRSRVLAENREGRPAMLYVHPREIDPDQPRLPLPWLTRKIHYYGVASCEDKLRNLITPDLHFSTIAEYLPRVS